MPTDAGWGLPEFRCVGTCAYCHARGCVVPTQAQADYCSSFCAGFDRARYALLVNILLYDRH